MIQSERTVTENMSLLLTAEQHLDTLQRCVIDEVSYKWKEIAIALGFTVNKYMVIEANKQTNEDRLLDVFTEWLKLAHGTGEKRRTLETVRDILVDRDCRDEAEGLVKALSQPSMTEESESNSQQLPSNTDPNLSSVQQDTDEHAQPVKKVPQWFQEAKDKHGSIIVKVVRSVFTGGPRVGKTSVKYSLLHDEPREDKTSTSILETPDIAIQEGYFERGDIVWKPAEESFVSEIISMAKIKAKKQNPSIQVSSPQQHNPTASSDSTGVPDEDKDPEDETDNDSTSSELSDAEDNSLMLLYDAQKSFLDRFRNPNEEVHKLREVTFVYLLDTGGQSSFQDALPMLLDFPCNFVQTFNASCKLTDPYDDTYCRDGKTEVRSQGKNMQTPWELMQQSLMAAYTMSFKHKHHLKPFRAQDPELHIFIVGTHLDKVVDSVEREELLSSHDKVLQQTTSKVYHDFMKFPRITYKDHELYALLDSQFRAESDHSKKVLSDLRKQLSDEDACMKLTIPKLWYCLLLIIRKIDKKMWRYTDLKQFCIDESYIDENQADEQLQALLSLFHSLGFFVYFNLPNLDNEEDWVCSEATFLYKEISKIFSVQYSTGKEKNRFRETGEILKAEAQKLFKKLEIHESIPPFWLLDVLHHVGLAAKVTSDSDCSYFLPIVLPSRKDLEGFSERGTVANLGFTFRFTKLRKSHFYGLPTGIFHCLVVDIANTSSAIKSTHKWKECPDESDHNIAKFYELKLNASICLVKKVDHIELVLLVQKHSTAYTLNLSQLCAEIKSEMEMRIRHVGESLFGKDFNRKATLMAGVPCTKPSCLDDKGDHLLLFLEEDSISGWCSKRQKPGELQPKQLIWMRSLLNEKDLYGETEGYLYLNNSVLKDSNGDISRAEKPTSNGSDRDWKQILQSNHHVYLLKNLCIKDIVPNLLQGLNGTSLITSAIRDEICNASNMKKANEIFLNHLNKGTLTTLTLFYEILCQTSADYPVHGNVADRLKRDTRIWGKHLPSTVPKTTVTQVESTDGIRNRPRPNIQDDPPLPANQPCEEAKTVPINNDSGLSQKHYYPMILCLLVVGVSILITFLVKYIYF